MDDPISAFHPILRIRPSLWIPFSGPSSARGGLESGTASGRIPRAYLEAAIRDI